MSARIITLIILIIIILIYVLYNTQPVEVKFLFWEAQISKALITLGSFLAGIILGLVVAKIDQFNKARREKALQKQLEQEGR
ncbi:MAG: LapA family protein [Deltaproteobacteria bacterium]|nr:LapA family protein [Deltaproteobacteria bacterium]